MAKIPIISPDPDCPHDAAKGERITPEGLSYTGFFDWADDMVADGWGQRECTKCGLWTVWFKKTTKESTMKAFEIFRVLGEALVEDPGRGQYEIVVNFGTAAYAGIPVETVVIDDDEQRVVIG